MVSCQPDYHPILTREDTGTNIRTYPAKRALSFLILLAVLLVCSVAGTGPGDFPPVQGPYTGDYICITEPGRYSLEHSLTHQYPAGVIIAAPSVILDGQGYSVKPASAGSPPTVGIWICLADSAGNPVTGVTIRNLSIEGEDFGVYAEGSDSSFFSWGKNRSGDPAMANVTGSPRSFTLSEMSIQSCGDGITLNGQKGVRVSDLSITGSQGSGITIHDGQAQIIRCSISGSAGSGIRVSGGTGSEISSSSIRESGESGIRLEKVSGITIYDNILDNARNLDAGPENGGIILATSRREVSNIVGGPVSGGNYWAGRGFSLVSAAGGKDQDSDGISDSPYEPAAGISDPLPLLKPGDAVTNGILTINPVSTPFPPTEPEPVQAPVSIISGIHAAIIHDTIPPEMNSGASYPVELHLINDGSDDWIPQHQIGIMALEETAKYGPEWMVVTVPGKVESGKTQVVRFTLRAPVKTGTYVLKYLAAREGSGVEVIYGRPYSKTVTVF
jgi:nitrous oxidase accessory protein NosD